MRIVSVNVGLPRQEVWRGRTVTTGIFKQPVAGRVKLGRLNLEGDRQADLSVHGGPDKALYAYPAEHYTFWQKELPGMELPWGMFGENLTIEGLLESDVGIGDRFRIGSAVVMATQPRVPCYKLALKFGRDDIVKRFLRSGRSGFYLAVLEEGEVGSGDAIARLARDAHKVTVADINRLYTFDKHNLQLLRRVITLPALPRAWREHFATKIPGV